MSTKKDDVFVNCAVACFVGLFIIGVSFGSAWVKCGVHNTMTGQSITTWQYMWGKR